MLLALWGPHAVGKTTFMQHMVAVMQKLQPTAQFKRTMLIQADLEVEWMLSTGYVRTERWKIPQLQKRGIIHEMVADDCKLYIVESARYFSGLYPVIVSAFKQCKGGAQFVIPTASPEDLQYFIQQRCLMKGKPYRADVWGPRAKYESDLRYTNPMRKWLLPAGVPCEQFRIGRDRKAWQQVEQFVWQKIRMPNRAWYHV